MVNSLDKFYTKDDVSLEVTRQVKLLAEKYPDMFPRSLSCIVEPSAGGGSFCRAVDKVFPGVDTFAYDLEPEAENIITRDFLLPDKPEELAQYSPRDTLVIGNPPFGKRAALAVEFINKSLEYADTVAFIVPIQLQKYLTQKKIVDDARLLYSQRLEDNAFTEFNKDYSLRTVFQVWSLRDPEQYPRVPQDMRIREKPPTRHPDFEMWLYNCTQGAAKFFDYDWDFAVLRQGWDTFEVVPRSHRDSLSRKKQWMFFKPHTEQAREVLLSCDFNALGEKNTSVKGFGKSDVVEYYTQTMKGKTEKL